MRPKNNLFSNSLAVTVIQVILMILLPAILSAQVFRPFSSRYTNPSVRGNIVYVSNSIISSSGFGTGSPGTGEVPPAGSSLNNNSPGIFVDIDTEPAPVTLFPMGSAWKYFSNGTRPANWNTVGFDDSAWPSGVGEFGYGDGPTGQVTCVPSGNASLMVPDACNPITVPNTSRFVSYYFRKTINIGSVKNKGNFIFNYLRDDGIVVYVNGREVFRNNMPAGTINNTTLASSDITGTAESAVNTYTLPTNVPFVPGDNVIAVEIHNAASAVSNQASLDMSFDMSLQYTQTFNSSSADLAIPTTCNEVIFAGLYWTASAMATGTDTTWRLPGFDSVQFKIPGASAYQTVRAEAIDKYSGYNIPGLTYTGYQCFANVTSIINTLNANGTYTLANIAGPYGLNNSCGGWTMVIAYSNPSLQLRNLNVFDGCVMIVSGQAAIDIPLSGFLTPPVGPVSCELGTVVLDGDRGSSDAFSFRQQGAPTFYNLATTTVPFNGSNDAFNSKISQKGVLVTNRNPALMNTLGYDASIFDLPNTGNAQFSNSQTAATIRISSPSEGYLAQVISASISQYNPTFAFSKSSTDINGGTTVMGDSIRYRLDYRNVGNDISLNTTITDNIPVGTSYKPGTIRINGAAKTDAAGDDEAEYDFTNNRVVYRLGTGANAVNGGSVGLNVAGNVQFDVYTSRSCDLMGCLGNTIRNTARINYTGNVSGNILYDSSGVDVAGCITPGHMINVLPGVCSNTPDTIMANRCPSLSVLIPANRYVGYRIYRALPFTVANLYNPITPVTTSGVYYAFFAAGNGCNDTVRIRVVIGPCPDIDDDNDGIPDYVEINNPLALGNHDADALPNWNDPDYPGFVDHNSDGVHDLFDPGADLDNDGIPNFYDVDYPGFVDINGDGVNDTMDADRDGIPNHLDLDSDNDGIPDVVESYGADQDGDGVIDNYSSSDNDGLSQNVDASNTGVSGSGNGLGAQDLDGDGVPNYLDLDSDNDGIPDVVEAGGADASNDGRLDGFVDIDSDGLSDIVDSDIGNDGIAEMPSRGLLRTGAPISAGNGRAASYPYNNFDNDGRANPYDLDSDMDGISDVAEAGFADADFNGMVDGPVNANGWNVAISNQAALGLRNSDSDPNPDYLDIDSDGDGIPDNIEGQPTATYRFPAYADTDNDGLDNAYDYAPLANTFGGSGITPYDRDLDGIPDYRDLDSDSDGQPDIIEGSDFNLNGQMDDLVMPLGTDADGDGLDDRFDLVNSATNRKGTSAMMGTSGSLTGDASPQTRALVQRTLRSGGCTFERDWRCVSTVLPIKYLHLNLTDNDGRIALNWTAESEYELLAFEVERSVDNINFVKIATQASLQAVNERRSYPYNDNINSLHTDIVFYRIKVLGRLGEVNYSNTQVARKQKTALNFTIQPNPASELLTVKFYADHETMAIINIVDAAGQVVLNQRVKAMKGSNSILLNGLSKFPNGVYTLRLAMDHDVQTAKLLVQQ